MLRQLAPRARQHSACRGRNGSAVAPVPSVKTKILNLRNTNVTLQFHAAPPTDNRYCSARAQSKTLQNSPCIRGNSYLIRPRSDWRKRTVEIEKDGRAPARTNAFGDAFPVFRQ